MILLIDNYDSFSYNLYQMIGEIEPDVKVVRNDEISVDEIRRLKPVSVKRWCTGLQEKSPSSGYVWGIRPYAKHSGPE